MVDYKYADLYLQDSVDKQLSIAYDGGMITNSELHLENFELQESICSDTQLLFGSCEASVIKFRVSNIVDSLKDKWLTVSEILNGNTDEPFSFGKYKVYSDAPTADRKYRDVTAYDAMYDIINSDVAVWYNAILPALDSTVTLKGFRKSFFANFGLEEEDISLVNDDMLVSKTLVTSELSGKTVINAICEINGCFARIGRNGRVKYIVLNDSNNSTEIKVYKHPFTYEDYIVRQITKLQICQDDENVTVGGGDNEYIIQDNFLIYEKSKDELSGIAEKILSVISQITYRPIEINTIGNPCIEPGDRINIITGNATISTYVLNRTMNGIHALKDNYLAEGQAKYTKSLNSVWSRLDGLRIKVNAVSQEVKESKALNIILSNEYQGISTDAQGNYTTFPECYTKIQVLYGQMDITEQVSLSATESDGIVGTLDGTSYIATGLTEDSGWADIKATYLAMTTTKRFTISKVKGGSNVKMLNTDLSLTQEMLTERGAVGHSRNWTVMTATTGLNAGDSVIIQVYNSSKDNSEAFIMATVNEVLSTNRINATSAGLLDKGDSGRVYILEPSATVIKRGQDSVPVPDAITFSAFYRDGGSASRTAYAGRFIVETSTDGNTWSKVYTSAADETSCKYELYTALEDGSGNYIEDGNGNVLVAWYDESSVMMRATLYAAGGTTTSLDMQTVPVVIDVAALTHWQIFNLLTNDGTWEGLYHENGHLYINASVLAAGIIRSKDGKSVVIDLDNGNVDLVGNIRTKKTLLYDETTGLYLQCQLDGTGVHVEIYELVNGTYNLIGETWVRDGLIEMSQTNGYGANYGTNEVLLTDSANGTRVRVANEPNAAQLELVANYDTVGDPLMAVATSTRRYITGLTDPEYPLWAVNKRYVDNLAANLQAQIDALKG